MFGREKWELLGTVSVDSGKLVITDPCYLEDWVSDIPDYDNPNKYGYSYSGACSTTGEGNNLGGELAGGKAVVFLTGYGDGRYEIYAKYQRGIRAIKEVKIVLLK